jgi:hypothetical protein
MSVNKLPQCRAYRVRRRRADSWRRARRERAAGQNRRRASWSAVDPKRPFAPLSLAGSLRPHCGHLGYVRGVRAGFWGWLGIALSSRTGAVGYRPSKRDPTAELAAGQIAPEYSEPRRFALR